MKKIKEIVGTRFKSWALWLSIAALVSFGIVNNPTNPTGI